MPSYILQLIQLRRKAQRKYYQSRDPADKAIFKKPEETFLKSLLITDQQNGKNFSLRQTLKIEKIWKLQKTLKNPAPPITALIDQRNNLITYDPEKKAEIFASILQDRFTPNPTKTYVRTNFDFVQLPDTLPPFNEIIKTLPFQPSASTNEEDNIIQENELINQIKTINPNKACGPDFISGTMIKHLPKIAIKFILQIMNACLTIGYYPQIWKSASIIMINKPNKNAREPINYRPISLLSHLSKIFERILLPKITNHLEANNVIPGSQFGFRKGHSSEIQTFRLALEISSSLSLHCSLPAIFFDFSQAFDKVNHRILLEKCIKFLPKQICLLIHSYLTNRTFKVIYQSHRSTSKPILAGVPQGAVLSPLLFSLYLYDLPQSPHITNYLFADDVAFTSKFARTKAAVSRLQNASEDHLNWSKLNGLSLNTSKCQAIIFTWRHETTPDPIQLQGNTIPWSDCITYLGLKFDNKLTWANHFKYAAQTMGANIARLYPLLKASSIKEKTKTLLYTMCISSAGTYACISWATAAKSNTNYLIRAENRFIRIAFKPNLGIPFETYLKKHNTPTISTYIIQTASKQIEEIFKNLILQNSFHNYFHFNKKPSPGRIHLPTDARFLIPP